MKRSKEINKKCLVRRGVFFTINLLVLVILSACSINLTYKIPSSSVREPRSNVVEEEKKQIDPNAAISGNSGSSSGMRESFNSTATASSLPMADTPSANATAGSLQITAMPLATEAPKFTPTPSQYKPFSGCFVSQLHKGDSAYVNYDTGRVSMRTEPIGKIADATVVRKLDGGESVHIIVGPKCDLGWIFWEVRTVNSEYGWIPEGDGTEFFFIPVSTVDACPGAKPGRLKVGEQAFVEPEPEDFNRIYPEPKIESDKLIYRMPPGSYMQVLEGPVCGNGKEGVWWKVRADSGDIGWTRESDYAKDYYFIAPVIRRP